MSQNTDLKKTAFFQNLTQSGTDIKITRATLVVKQVSGELDAKLTAINNELNQLEMDISSHEDLSPTNEYSLEIATKDFKAKDWLQQYYTLLDIQRMKKDEQNIYLEIKKRQFETTVEDGKQD